MSRRGFTLTELLAVMALVSLMAGLAVPRYARAVLKTEVSELRNRIRTAELGIDEAQASAGVLPVAGAPAGVVPPSLEPHLTGGLFDTPYGVRIRYVVVDGGSFGAAGDVAALILLADNQRGAKVLDAARATYPTTVLRFLGGAIYPMVTGARLDGSATRQPQAAPTGAEQGAASAPTAQTDSAPGDGPPPRAGGSSSNPSPSTPTPSPTTSPSYPPGTPSACFTGQLPPGQQKQCASGGGNSHWFRHHGGNH